MLANSLTALGSALMRLAVNGISIPMPLAASGYSAGMSRPRTKGETIPVQLPLSIDRRVRQSAAEKGISPGTWIETVVAAGFSGRTATPPDRVQRIRAEVAEGAIEGINGHASKQVSDCRHQDVLRHQTGMWICKSCQATSRNRGESWQV